MDSSFENIMTNSQNSSSKLGKRKGTVKTLQVSTQSKRFGTPVKNSNQQTPKTNNFKPELYLAQCKNLTLDDINDLKEIFDTLNQQQNGILAPHEIQLILSQNNSSVNKDFIYDLIAEFDEDEQGGLTFEDFLKLMNNKPKVTETQEQIKKIFKKYDPAAKGCIDGKDLKKILRHLQIDMDDATQELILKNCSADGKVITFQDFYNVMIADVYQ